MIDTLNEDEVIELIALAWIGRGDFERSDWEEAKALAEERHGRRSFSYLAGMPALGDYLEEGLAAIGHSVTRKPRRIISRLGRGGTTFRPAECLQA
ncbi:MAG: DUF3775 domain-containing protein [Aliidongia sp.]